MRLTSLLRLSVSALALQALVGVGAAQEVASEPREDVGGLNDIIVTGVAASDRTVLSSSIAVTTIDDEELLRKSPRSTADLLELIPGVFVEDSGGEVSNNFSVRGLAGGGQTFVQFQEDGLPIFYQNSLSDILIKQELSVNRVEAIRGGTAGIVSTNSAGLLVNFLTRKPGDAAAGSVRLTGSDFNTARVDFWYGAPISDEWAFSVGGFYRNADSVRDTGFTGDRGGIIRARLQRETATDLFAINVKLVDENNTFLLPIPLQNPDDPQPVPGFDVNFGTLTSLDNATQQVLTSPGTGMDSEFNDATEGVDTTAFAIGYEWEHEWRPGVRLFSKGRYTEFDNNFQAIFTFDNNALQFASVRLDPDNPASFDPRGNVDIQLLLETFAPAGAVQAALQRVGTGEIISGAALDQLNGNGLIAEAISASNPVNREEFVNDFGFTWQTERNSLKAGFLFFSSRLDDGNVGATTFITEIADQPDRLDIVALNADGEVVGSLTDNGILNFGTWGEFSSQNQFESYNFYFNDEFEVTPKLRVDAGVRVEHFDITRQESIGEPGPFVLTDAFLPGGEDRDNVIANNAIGLFQGGVATGQFNTIDFSFTDVSWTVGGNYQPTENFALYGRFARGFQVQNLVADPVQIGFAEFGGRFQNRQLSASVTGFRTNFEEFGFFDESITNPDPVAADIRVLGFEFDLTWSPIRYFQLQTLGVIQNSRIDGSIFDGNQPSRTPERNYRVTASVFPIDGAELSLSFARLSDRFADVDNTLRLPAYSTVDVSGRLQITRNLNAFFSGSNLTNSFGLTEGNPRAGFAEITDGAFFFFARPILGRNFVFGLNYDF